MNKTAAGYNMKNAEFESVRGVAAVVVSMRVACLLSAAKRDFVWYLQGLSLKDGGFKRVARELVEMFPERLATSEMRRAGVVPDKLYPAELVEAVEYNLGIRSYLAAGRAAFPSIAGPDEIDTPQESEPPMLGSYLIGCCRKSALGLLDCQRAGESRAFPSIEQFLVELCVDPKIQFSLPGVDRLADEMEVELAAEANPKLAAVAFQPAMLDYFHDIIGALLEYRAKHQKKVRDGHHLTAIGRKIWETLDYALASRNMVLLDGLEGRGKTEAVKAWCELHTGRARFVSLKGVTNKTTAFREIASALGITYAYGRTGPEMQARIEDVLNRSKIMLVIDEAHFAFNQTRQMSARPELIDWIDTAICNRSVPVALVTTPQFIACMARAKNQVEWNFNQFRRRVSHWVALPEKNSEADLFAVARKLFQKSGEVVIKKVVGYALLSRRDLSGLGDVAKEVRAMVGAEDGQPLSNISLEQVTRAIDDFLIPSDQAFRVALAEAESKLPRQCRRPPMPAEPSHAPAADPGPSRAPLQAAEPEESTLPAPLNRLESREGSPVSGSCQPVGRRASLEAALTDP